MDMSLACLVLCLWVVGCFGLVPILTLLMRIRHGDLCLSAHMAPPPVQKKKFSLECVCFDTLAGLSGM